MVPAGFGWENFKNNGKKRKSRLGCEIMALCKLNGIKTQWIVVKMHNRWHILICYLHRINERKEIKVVLTGLFEENT
ncbi:MAG: hypothetical protein IJV82_06405 [Oscillospiraceae bacterium]|nr:hypothetical protein [Oscillospiraceae bacterium]